MGFGGTPPTRKRQRAISADEPVAPNATPRHRRGELTLDVDCFVATNAPVIFGRDVQICPRFTQVAHGWIYTDRVDARIKAARGCVVEPPHSTMPFTCGPV